MGKLIDLTGKRFGKLTVLYRIKDNKKRMAVWHCRCDCGNETNVTSGNLQSGTSKTCGCSKSAMGKPIRHGKSKTKLYRTFQGMKQRCFNKNCPDFLRYGNRGITVCDEWKNSFSMFEKWSLSNGYAENLTLDRIDVNGNYCPENCRWISKGDQAKNRRNNIFYKGKCLSEWAQITGISRTTISRRIKCGWTIEKAVKTPNLLLDK